MAIKEKEVWIEYHGNTTKHYENKGYEFSRKRGAKFLVKVKDLPKKSNIKVTKICDICNNEISPKQSYLAIVEGRSKNSDNLDMCRKCSCRITGKQSGVANEENCIAKTHPEFAKLFWNKEDTFKYTYGSTINTDFKCPQCGNKVENKIINTVYKSGVYCICKDGISYPEKFFYSFLIQLDIEFEFQITFDWSKNIKTDNLKLNGTKRYDFYLKELNTIIELHGRQHFKETNLKRRRTLKEEKENDEIKKIVALKNGVKNYLEIDCRDSSMEFIKKNILASHLSKWFDLSKIDWLKCHNFTCKSLVVEASKLFNNGKNRTEISKILGMSHETIGSYLKSGTLLNICNYNPKQEIIKGNKKGNKAIIQLSLNGEFIREWESITSAGKELGLDISGISKVCRGKGKIAGEYKWMFKEEY